MMKWIRALLGLCEHKWETINAYPVFRDPQCTGNPHAMKYTLHCQKCGDIIVRRV